MEDLKLALIQSQLHWEDPEANLEMFDRKISKAGNDRDIIILPEMFTTGFSMNTDRFAEDMNGPALKWMKSKAESTGSVITGSIMIREEGKFYNRLFWVYPDGKHRYYDKRHLFVMAKEDQFFSRGKNKIVVEWKGWKICPLICFDLRFPAFVRNQEYYDAMICVANWPAKRGHHWRTLLPARAVENQCYVAAVNRVGKDGNDIDHRGDSCVIDPMGDTLVSAAWQDTTLFASLNHEMLVKTRRHMPFLKDQDAFNLS